MKMGFWKVVPNNSVKLDPSERTLFFKNITKAVCKETTNGTAYHQITNIIKRGVYVCTVRTIPITSADCMERANQTCSVGAGIRLTNTRRV